MPPGSGAEIHEVLLGQARMEGKLDGVLAMAADHESRIRGLERAVWKAAGGAGTLGTIVGLVVAAAFGVPGPGQ